MVQFNELRITPDGKHLIIDASIKNAEDYNNVIIDSIIIDNQDTFIPSGPSNKPLYTSKVSDKSVRLILSTQDIGVNIQDNMLFVYVVTLGTNAPNIPNIPNIQLSFTLGTVVYLYPLYRHSIYYLKELDSCKIPVNLIDIILRIKALELSIKTGNYPKAIKYWNKWIKGINKINTNNCNCYERSN